MVSATKAAASRGGAERPLLKGSDLKKSEATVTVFVHAVREAPDEWRSSLVMDIEETHGCTAVALNKTNVKRLVSLIGDDYEEWAGYEVTFAKVRVTNPTTRQPAVGLEVETVKKSKRKPKPVSDDDIPF
jgi:hypothetical protein